MSYGLINLIVIILLLSTATYTGNYLIALISVTLQVIMLLVFRKYKESLVTLLNYAIQLFSFALIIKDLLSLIVSLVMMVIVTLQLNKGLNEVRQYY